jgi:hypothetical protein
MNLQSARGFGRPVAPLPAPSALAAAIAYLWAELLELSHTLGNPEAGADVHGALLGARCFGARLELAGDTLRLVAGEDTEAYADVRERCHTAQRS